MYSEYPVHSEKHNPMKRNFTTTSINKMTAGIRGIFLMSSLLLTAGISYAQVGIQSFNATYTAASTGKTYNMSGADNSPLEHNDYSYKYGTSSGVSNNILNFSSFGIGSNNYAYRNITNAYVKIRRHNNSLVSGVRELLWYEGTNTDVYDGAAIRLKQPYQSSMEVMFNGARGLNAGTDNIFNNSADGNGNNNNIERFDYIIPDGYTIVANSQEGFIVMDRGVLGAHDPFCVAVITSLNSSDNPSAYTSVLRLNSSNYGSVNPIPVMTSYVLRMDEGESKLKASTTTDASQGIGGVFIRYSDLGLSNGTVIYGYSVFGGDFPSGASGSKVVDWNNTTYFPTNTEPGNGGLDMLAVSGVFQLSNALAPLANDVTRAAVCNPDGTGKVSVPSLSATDLNSGGVISSYKIITIPSASQGVLYYYNGSSYVPVSAGMTLTISQSSSLKFDPADGFMDDAVFQYTATNNFGLVSNIAYGTIPVYTMPTTSAGSDVAICSGGSTLLNATGATSFSWSPSTGLSCTTCSNPTASPSATQTYTITGSHPASGCSTTATITVSVNPTPTVSAGSSVSVCSGESATLGASGAATYNWSPSTGLSCTACASPVATPGSTTTYTVTGTTGSCSATSSVTVTVKSLPSLYAGSDVTKCQGVAASLYASGASSYSWLPSTGLSCTTCTNPSATPSVTTTYTVTGTGSNGCTKERTVTVSINPLPAVSAGAGIEICSGTSASLSASGASSYSWAPSTGLSCTSCSNPLANPSSTKTYTVTGTSAAGCTASASVTVSVNPQPSSISGSINVCPGVSGTLSCSTSGGTWSSSNNTIATVGSATGVVTGVAAGTATVTYMLPTGCYATKVVTVNSGPAAISGPSEICVSATANMSSGTSGGTWSSSNTGIAEITASTGVVTAQAQGTATISYILPSGCAVTKQITVNANPSAITGTLSVCVGGSATLSAIPTTGTWTSGNASVVVIGNTSGIISGISAGTANVTYTLPSGCSVSAVVTTNPLPAAVSGASMLCAGTAATYTSGGSGGAWSTSNGAIATINTSTGVLNALSAGTCNVTYTLATGCLAVKTITVNPSVLLTATTTNLSCYAANNGTIDLTVSGGTAPFTYSWSNGANTQDISGLASGTYSVTVSDAKGCSATLSRTITQPSVVAASAMSFNVSCNGGSNGIIDLTVSGGTSPYTYSWSNGATTQDLSGLTSGTYNVTVSDANGCNAYASKTITQPAALATSATGTNINCNGGSNGSIDLSVTGGTTPYSYSWNNGATTQDLTGLTAGTYSVTVTDAKGCTTTRTKTISEPAALVATTSGTDVNCYNGANGTIDLTVTGGTTPYTYSWGGGFTTEDRTGLTAGTYTVVVTDNKGCTATATKTIAQPTALTAVATNTNVSCNGGTNGTVDLTVAGGTTPYTYAWNNGGTTQDISDLTAGTYSVVVTDGNGCTATASKTITQPSAITATTSFTNALCYGCANGTASVAATGGTAPYTYVWSNGATTASVSGLIAGTYTVTVKDAHNCTVVKNITITQPSVFSASASGTGVSCNGGNNGTATVSVSGGTTPYTYAWSNGATTVSLTGLTAGTYSVVVTDANSYTTTATVTVAQPSALSASASATNVNCNGGNNGTIDLTVSGGTSPYTYSWSNGATTQDLSSLTAGTYSVLVTDAHGCTATVSKTVTQPSVLTATAFNTNVSCNGGSNGTIDLTAAGGTTPYTYSWSNGATTQDLSGLNAGTYSVVVTDNKGCTATVIKTITQPATLSASATVSNVSCNGGTNGVIDLTVSGGTAAYTYNWSNGAATQDLSGVAAGTYSVVVTDNKGCTATVTKTVTEPAPVAAVTAATDALCYGCANGTAGVTASGGTAPYTYEWNTGAVTASVTGLIAGNYTVTIKDANNCMLVRTFTITQPAVFEAAATGTNVSCNGGNNGTATVTATGGTTPYTYSWNNGATTATATGLAAGTYTVVVTDANSYTTTATVSVSQPAALAASAVATHINCNGGDNGTIDLTVSGGTSPYTYSWSNGATTQDLSSLTAGAYSVLVTDAHGCTATVTKTITQPALLAATATATNVSCYNGANGTIDLTVTGGTTPYTYSWGGGFTTEDRTGLTAGTYSVVVTDAKGCTATVTKTITEPTALGALAVAYNVSCAGGNNGSIDLTVSGGTTAYTYSWSNGATTQDIIGLTAGTYSVLVTDAHGCTATVTKTVTQPSPVAATATATDALCNGCANGTATASATGGTAPYTYAWSNGATTANATGLIAGTYTVTVTDAHGCTTTTTATVGQPDALIAAATNTNVSCNGGANGTADLTVSGGTTPYTYSWSNGAATQDLSALSAGTYNVTVSDAHGYTVAATVTVTEPAVLTASATAVNVNCYGESNGSVDLTVSGGTTAYTYSWSNGATTQDITGLTAGTYSVLVTDAHGCTATVTKTVTQPAVLAATATATDALCNGCANGTATASATGGTAPYTYAWSNGATTANATGLIAGTYTVTVTDAHGCTTTTTATVGQPDALIAAATNTNVSCNGGANGTADLTVSGGTTPYTYSWSNGAATQDLSGLSAGTYNVTVSDAHGYTVAATVTVTEPAVLTASATAVNVNCYGESNGSIDLTVSGGTTAYTYSWSNGATTQDITGLAAGTYSVLVTDAHGCTATVTKTVTQPAVLAATATATDALCNGCANGTATASATGGTAPYTYAWSNGATIANATGLVAGTYTVTVTDAHGCITTTTATVGQPDALIVAATNTNVSCNGGTNGTADLTVSGGTTPYTYSWSNGAATQDLSALSAGTYNVTVSDAHGYTVAATVTVTEPAVLTASATAVNVNCYGESNGSADLTVSGGTTAYTYSWSNGATTQDITGLAAGTYSVLVTDAHGCTATVTKTITQPAVLAATATATDALCNGCANGTATASATGGTAPYTYAWSNGATTANATGLVAGTYTVMVTDAHGCTTTTTATVGEPDALIAAATNTNVSCNGGANGTADLTVSGGTTPYTYSWSNGAATQDLSALSAGTYNVTVSDAHGYTVAATVTVTEPAVLTASATAVNVNCYGESNGSVDLTVSGGTTAYTYSWSNGATTQDITGLTAGTYSVLVTDAHGCMATVTKTVTQPSPLAATATATDALCNGCANGTATASATGGTAPYTYAWSNGATTVNATGLIAGTYTVTVTDAHGCTTTTTATVGQPDALIAAATNTNVSCNGGTNGTADLTVSGGTTPYTYSWSNGAATQDLSGLSAGTYNVTVSDAHGYTVAATVTVTEPAVLTASATAVNVNCYGESNGSIDLTVSGGTTAYTYSWSNGATTQDITGLAAGTYSVLVTDAHGCTATVTKTVTQPAVLAATATATDALCNGCANGTATASATGGTAPYTYAWSNGATTANATGLIAGTYTVTVTDAHGCTTTTTATVGQPDALIAAATNTNVSCNGGANGTADLTVSGGTTPYTYSWSNGAATQDLSGLSAGTYNVTVSDAHGYTVAATVTVTEPAVLTASATAVNVNCYGESNGSVDLTVSGGTTAYTYSWSNGATTQDITGLAAGTYSVLVADAHGCTATVTKTVTQPAVLAATATATDALCNGCANGTATASATGGTAPYTYAWSNGATTANATGLIAGTYTVTVTDAHGCTTTTTATVGQPDALIAAATNTNVSCNGGANGTADLTVSGGTTPYTYSWSNGAATQDLSGLSAGTYNVTVSDAHGYTVAATVTVTEPAAVIPGLVVTNVSCNGAGNGSVDMNITGGTAPYTYSWSNGATTQDITTLTPGAYSVVVTDANGCTGTATATVTEPAPLSESCLANQVACNGGNNGYLTVTVSGGTAPYAYNWNTGAVTAGITGLTAGAYSVTITDANGCSLVKNYTVTQPSALVVTDVASDITCNGANNGSVDLTVSGGTAPYLYTWSNGAATQDVTGLAVGTYTVVVKDAHLCKVTRIFSITQPAVLTGTAVTADVTCAGAANGSVDVTMTGGTAPYTYNWSNGAATQDVAGLSAGTYSVAVTDANGCTWSNAYVITEPAMLAASGVAADAMCNGGNGTVDATVTGGTALYTYSWSNGAATQDITAGAGTYTLTVTDANGCTDNAVFTISAPAPLAVSGTTNTVICGCLHGMGEIYTTVTGGTAPYSYLWSDGATTSFDTGLWTGTYSVVVTDANGCTVSDAYSVVSPWAMSVFNDVTNVSCHGAANGAVEISVTGGIPPYSYNWSNGSTSSAITGLSGGTYSVTITDANGCSRDEVYTVSEPSVLAAAGTAINANCHGANGSVDMTVSGGTAPYTFSWSNGASTEDLIAGVGTYNFTVTDANGCTASQTFTITQPDELILTGDPHSVVCGCLHGMGEIYTTVTGGTAPYSYLWSDGATTSFDTGLWTGDYSVMVTDANGCTVGDTYSIISPWSMSVFSDVVNVSCNGDANGAIEVAVTGGIPPYSFDWSNGETAQMITGLTAGTYSVTITDANGCSRHEVFTVTEPDAISLTADVTNVLCSGPGTGSIDLTISGGTEPYTISWSNGSADEDLSMLDAGVYFVNVTDDAGCGITAEYTIEYTGTTVAEITGGTANMCTGASAILTGTPAGGTWSSNNPMVANAGVDGNVVAINAGNATITYTITNACGEFFATHDVTVNTVPSEVTVSGMTVPVCAGTAIVLSASQPGGSWSCSNAAVAAVGSTGVVTTLSAGTAVISYALANECGSAVATRIVTVDGTPYAGVISGPDHLCVDGIIPLTSSVPGGVWSNGTPLVAVTCPCNSGQVTGIAPGVATLSYTVTNACGAAHATYQVTVNTVPTVTPGLIAPVVSGYGDATMPFTTTGSPVSYSIAWSTEAAAAGFADVAGATLSTSPLTVAVPATVSEGTYTGVIRVSNGYCTSVAQPVSITVNESVNIYTYAGTGVNGNAGNGNAATLATLSHPYGIAVDCDGNSYIADFENAVVRKVSPTGVISTVAGTGVIGYSGDGGPATAANMSHARGVAVDAAGNVYFSDYNNHAVRKVSTSGIITKVVGNGAGYSGDGGPASAARVSYPSGLTLDGAGNLYIADNGNAVIRKVTPSGIISTFAGTGIPGYAGDNGPATAATFFQPAAVHADGSGNLYVADWGNQVVRKVDAAGIVTTIAGNGVAGYVGDGGPATAAKLNRPNGITSDNAGNIYFTEQLNSVVRKVNAAGFISTVAGNTLQGYSGDGGPALLAKLYQPMGLASDCDGRIYIADNANYAVRIMGTYNRTPFFKKGSSQSIDVCTGSAPVAIDTNLVATDFDTAQTITWSVMSAPAHGTLAVSYATSSAGTQLTPSGMTYTPAGGYTGADVFVVKVDDGTANAVTTINVTVSAPPVAGTITGTAAICGSGVTHLTTTGTGGVWSTSDSSIAVVNSYGDVTGTGFGTADIAYTVTNGCGTATAVKTVTYNAMPFAGTVIGAAKMCLGNTIIYSATVPDGVWSSSNSAIATVDAAGNVHGVDTGVATISYAVTNACGTAYGLRNITVEILPVVGPVSGPGAICAGAATLFTNATPAGAWYTSDTSVATVDIVTGAVSGVSVGVITLSYVHNTSCGVVTTTKVVSVNPASVTVPAIAGPDLVCPGTSVTLTNTMTGGTWTSGNIMKATAGLTTGVISGISAGTANITYTVSHECGTSYTVKTMTVNPLPTVNPITGTMSICNGWTITAANATPGGVWSSSNNALATVDAAGNITGVAGGMPVISYSVTNYCGTAHATALVPVGTPPSVSAISGPSANCVASDITLANTTLGGTWTSSNIAVANVNSAGIVTGVGAGTVTITYSVHNGCGYSHAEKVLTINPLPVVGTISGPAGVCIGADITLSNSEAGGTWSSSNSTVATVGTDGVVSGLAAGTTTISYAVTNGCGTAVATKNVSVQVMFASIYTSHVSSVGGNDGCALLTVTGGVAPYTYLWSNGATTQNLSGLYAGIYSVLVTDANGDTVSATASVTGLVARGPGEGEDGTISAANTMVMHGAHPNPFVSSTIIRFNLPVGTHATIDVFNAATGSKVATVYNDYINAGEEYTATIDGSDLAPGVYIYRISTEITSYIGKVLLVK